MSTIPDELRAKLLADSTFSTLVGGRVHVNKVPQRPETAFLYMAVDSAQENDILAGGVGAAPLSITVAFEAVSYVAQSTAQAIKDRIRAVLHQFHGTLSAVAVQGIFLQETPDDYVPRNQGGDDGAFVTTGQLQVFL